MQFKDLLDLMDGKQMVSININSDEKQLIDDVNSFDILYNQNYLKLKVVKVAATVDAFNRPVIDIELEGVYEQNIG